MLEKILYTASASSTGDARKGHVRSSDGLLDHDLAMPPELGGPGGSTNPEQLFAAGYSACFHSAVKGTLKGNTKALEGSAVTAEVGIGPLMAGGYGLQASIHVELGGGISQEDAEIAVKQAHEICPYSNATRGNIKVFLTVEVS